MKNTFSWFGIDFGTTNSAAYSFTGTNESNITPLHYGDDEGRPFPSIVAINKKTGEVITGREAKERKNSLIEDHEYFHSIKTIIDSDQVWEIADESWTAEKITTEIFKALKKRVESDGHNILDEAVVAVPIGFSPGKKRHLRNAAEEAGIRIKMFISEPTAAFCSNYLSLKSCKNVAVFDWGGGTLDVVVLRVNEGYIEELATEVMGFAGNDIDKKLAEKMHVKFLRDKKHSLTFDELDPRTKDQLLTKCEKAKCDFEDEDLVSISINKYGEYGAVRGTIGYDFFSLLIENDVNKSIELLEKAIRNANMNIAEIDAILCVGGSSKLRPLREKLSSKFGDDMLFYPDKVMWDIAKGASMVATRPGTYKLSKSIGMLLSDGSYFPFFKKGQKIPTEEFKLTLGTVEHSLQGKNEARFIFTDAEDNKRREVKENFILPLRGFVDEKIDLFCYIDQDNIFRLKVGSNKILESSYKIWNYEGLKVGFKIEGE